ncbi:MAG: nitroreductase family protein [Anaerolineales bacterium]|nr:nitroreductase family protein [Anaerolineales bacterium]
MISNPVIEAMMNRKSIRKYKKDMPSDEVIETVVRAGQQAPFAYQLGSLLLSRGKKHPFGAPLLFTICVDSHRLETVMAQRDWKMINNDLSLLLFGIQDAALMAENMVIAAESLGMGSCFLGGAPYYAERIIKEYKLPPRVFPLVQLVMGYPAENPPPRPRYPLDFACFEGQYPRFEPQTIQQAMKVMDDGYLAQKYYRRANYMIRLEGDRAETYTIENYSWTEHISRKAGQWFQDIQEILVPLKKCGFTAIPEPSEDKE